MIGAYKSLAQDLPITHLLAKKAPDDAHNAHFKPLMVVITTGDSVVSGLFQYEAGRMEDREVEVGVQYAR
jgi:precorrin-6B methylase 1